MGSKVSRKLIALTPLLLVCGIVAQTILLVLAVILIVPCLIYPRLLNTPYLWITRGMMRIIAKNIIGHRPKAEMITQVSAETPEV